MSVFPEIYKSLDQNHFVDGSYSLVPIRYEDRIDIMKWRNEQIYHLRQARPLTIEDQENYFNTVVAKLFDQEKPSQLLFSYLKDGVCIGYGGLVHINWIDKNAEISFIINTELEKEEFSKHWGIYLGLIEQVAFEEINMHKIFTYAFDLRPHLYEAIEKVGYKREAVLKEHCLFNGDFKDVHIHSKTNNGFVIRQATSNDCQLYYDWANDEGVRASSFNSQPVVWDSHVKWFENNVYNTYAQLYVLELNQIPVGQIRLNFLDGYWVIGFSVDVNFRGKGVGKELVNQVIRKGIRPLKALVKPNNISSMKVFQNLGFREEVEMLNNENIAAFYIDN